LRLVAAGVVVATAAVAVAVEAILETANPAVKRGEEPEESLRERFADSPVFGAFSAWGTRSSAA
jgi:hypothetical protein